MKIGSRTNYICNVNQYSAGNASTTQPETSGSKTKHRPMPEIVEELSTCDEELTFDDMFLIKTHVGRGWRDVAKGLSYSDGQIDQFEENYRYKGIDEVNIKSRVLKIRVLNYSDLSMKWGYFRNAMEKILLPLSLSVFELLIYKRLIYHTWFLIIKVGT